MSIYRVYRIDPNNSVHTTDCQLIQQTTVDILDYPDSTFFLRTVDDVIQLRVWTSSVIYQGWTAISNVEVDPQRLKIVKMMVLIGN